MLEGGSLSLASCLAQFARPETLDARNEWYCAGCKAHVRATKTLQVWSLPRILVLHLKRFSANNAYINTEKIGARVDFPLAGLDLTGYQLRSAAAAGAGAGADAAGAAAGAAAVVTSSSDGGRTVTAAPATAVDGPAAVYDCFAVVNHFGSVHFGHYTAFTNPAVARGVAAVGADGVLGSWHELDDSSVRSATSADVVSEAAYVLLYVRRGG
jgi:ubiquitin C-terminal hydrolase